VAGPVTRRPKAQGPDTLPYDRRLARRLADDLLAARRELAACHAEAAEAADQHARALADAQAGHEAQLAELRSTETWRVGAAIVALPRWVRRQLRSRGR
jgi:hypothetical protein